MKKLLLIFSSFFLLANNAPVQEQELIAPEISSGFFAKEQLETKEFMVVSGHIVASEAAQKIIQKGGSAIDAAIAAQLVLNVVEPHASGIGGGGFLLYYDAKKQKSSFFDGRETAPQNINPDIFLDKNGDNKNFKEALKGGASVGVPGLLKMLKMAHSEHGKLPWFELFNDAINVAALGYHVTPRINNLIANTPHIKEFKEMKELFFQDKKPRAINDIIKNPDLANSLREIAANGINSFYQGKLGEEIVNKVQNSKINKGSLTLKDLANYKALSGDLICLNYRKNKVCSMPMPSSGGVTLLQILGILENFDLTQMEPYSIESLHLINEAMRLAYADRNTYTADSAFVDVPIKKMLDKKYLKERSFLINVDAAMINVYPGEFSQLNSPKYAHYQNKYEPPSTTHISILDKEGNAVSLTSSIEYSFGSGLMAGGFILNNQLTDFSFKSKVNQKLVANRIEAGKKPRSSMSPTFVFDKNDKLIMIVGSPGGARIISYVAKTIIATLDWQMDIHEAVNEPNFNKMNDTLELEEESYFSDFKPDLEKIGHKVKVRDLTSGIHAIFIDNERKIISAGIDKRREGAATGE